jgi:hypothetical protein
LFTFRVSRSEALLMMSSTSYIDVYRVTLALPCFNCALLVICERLAVLVFDLEYRDGALLYSCLVDLICYG